MPKFAFVLAAMVIGGLLAIQPGLNAEVAKRLGTPFGAGFLSILVSFLLAASLLMTTRQTFAIGSAAALPWHLWFAGAIGFIFVVGSLALAPILGASLLFASVIAGQLVVAVAVDTAGFGGYQSHGFDPWRIVGIALVLGGVWIFQRAA